MPVSAKKIRSKKTQAVVATTPQSLTPSQQGGEALIAQAIDKGVDVGTMERLLAMRRELKAEAAKEEFDTAMASFQADCPTIVKTREVRKKDGGLAYRYAPIESIVEQVKGALKANGFSYKTDQELKTDGVKITVRVIHAGGHSEETSMEVPFGTQTSVMSQSQVAAAASTFAKRYAFCNAFGILTGDEDTDAQPPQGGETRPETKRGPEPKAFDVAKAMIGRCTDTNVLNDYANKIASSPKYSEAEKSLLGDAIATRIDFLAPSYAANLQGDIM